MEQQREALLGQIWAAQDEAYDLMYEYDSLPHRYGAHILYQSEAHIIDLIGEHPEITVTELAAILKKTPSACSQIVRKLRAKGWVEQVRNAENNRIYNLYCDRERQTGLPGAHSFQPVLSGGHLSIVEQFFSRGVGTPSDGTAETERGISG